MTRNQRRFGFGVPALLILLAAGGACATSPMGRKQLIIVPQGEMDTMGVQAFQEMKTKTPVDKNAKVNLYVNCVAKPITQAAQGKTADATWEVVVFDDPQVNAFALPGGKIGVYSGLLKVATTDAQLGAVLGHEVGHVIAKHGAERVSDSEVAQLGLGVAQAMTGGSQYQAPLMAALGLGTQVGVLLPFSRTQESEADLIGLDLMAEAGFDPHAAVDLWHNMTAASKGAPPAFLSDHPANEARIQSLQQRLPEALGKYQQARAAGRAPHCTP